jgi:hypothetical protein
MATTLVLGASDIGSTTALRLRGLGHVPILRDEPRPPHPRCGMAFNDTWFERVCTWQGVLAKRSSDAGHLEPMIACGRALPVSDGRLEEVLEEISPRVVVDALAHLPAGR